MRLTKKKAIEISIELWTDLAKTGVDSKKDWAGWEKYGDMECACPLCEHSHQRADSNHTCDHCPYFKKFGGCEGDDTPYSNWSESETPEERKKYAKEFLEQLKLIRSRVNESNPNIRQSQPSL